MSTRITLIALACLWLTGCEEGNIRSCGVWCAQIPGHYMVSYSATNGCVCGPTETTP